MLPIYMIIILSHTASAMDFSLLDSVHSVKVEFSDKCIEGGEVIKNGVARYFETVDMIQQRTGSVDVTETLCDPGTTSVTARIKTKYI